MDESTKEGHKFWLSSLRDYNDLIDQISKLASQASAVCSLDRDSELVFNQYSSHKNNSYKDNILPKLYGLFLEIINRNIVLWDINKNNFSGDDQIRHQRLIVKLFTYLISSMKSIVDEIDDRMCKDLVCSKRSKEEIKQPIFLFKEELSRAEYNMRQLFEKLFKDNAFVFDEENSVQPEDQLEVFYSFVLKLVKKYDYIWDINNQLFSGPINRVHQLYIIRSEINLIKSILQTYAQAVAIKNLLGQ